MKKSQQKLRAGFTLIEILVVIGIIAILAAVVIISINPARQFAQARNSQRESNVNTILNAIGQNIADNKGVFTCSTHTTGFTAAAVAIGANDADLSCLTPTYIPTSIPTDPDGGTNEDAGYTIATSSTDRFTVCAPKHEEAAIPGSEEYCLTR